MLNFLSDSVRRTKGNIDCEVTFQIYGSFFRAQPVCHGKPCHEPHLGSPKPWLCPALISSDSLLLPAEGLSVLEGSVDHDVLNIRSQTLPLAPGRLPLASCPLRACSMLSDSCFGNEQHEIDACQTQPC